jgi:hypothetical protein
MENDPFNKLSQSLFKLRVAVKEILNQLLLLIIISTSVLTFWISFNYFNLKLEAQHYSLEIVATYIQSLLSITKTSNSTELLKLPIFNDTLLALAASFIIWAIVFLGLLKLGQNKKGHQVLEGVTLIDTKTHSKHLGKNISPIKLGNAHWYKNAEFQNLLVCGDPGTGKSQLLNQLLLQIRAKGDMAVIYDVKGNFIRDQSCLRDLIFSPFDHRSYAWDVWVDLKTELDLKAFAAAIIKENGQQDPFWSKAAQTVLVEALKKGKEKNWPFIQTIKFLSTSSFEELSNWLKGTKASSIFSNEKTAGSVMTQLINEIDCLNYLKPLGVNEAKFSINSWIDFQIQNLNEGNPAGWLFLPVPEKYKTVGTPIIAAQLELLANKILSQDTNQSKRIWLIIDELPSLPQMVSIQRLLAQGREYGVAGVIAVQNISQLKNIYGEYGANALIGNCSSFVSFRLSDQATASFISKKIGSHIRKELVDSRSHSKNDNKKGASDSQSEQIAERSAASETKIMHLKDLSAIFCCKGTSNPIAIEIEVQKLQIRHPAFIEAKDLHTRNQPYKNTNSFNKPETDSKPSKWEV